MSEHFTAADAETIVLATILKIINWFTDDERKFGPPDEWTEKQRAAAVFFILGQMSTDDVRKLRELSETDVPL